MRGQPFILAFLLGGISCASHAAEPSTKPLVFPKPLVDWVSSGSIRYRVTITDFSYSDGKYQKLYESLGDCAVNAGPEKAADFVKLRTASTLEEMERALAPLFKQIEGACGHIYWIYGDGHIYRKFSVNWSMMVPSIRRALYIKTGNLGEMQRIGFADLAQFPYRQLGYAPPMNLADCIVNKWPEVADALVRTKYGSNEFRLNVSKIDEIMPTCADFKENLDMSTASLRSSVSEAIYAHSIGAVSDKARLPDSIVKPCDDQKIWWEGSC